MKRLIPKGTGILWGWSLTGVICGLSWMGFAFLFLRDGFDEEVTRQTIRWSARIAVILFCLAFGASSVHHWIKNSMSWWLRMNRKYLGVSFAFIHLSHLFFLILLQDNFHPVFNLAKISSLMGGGLAYLFAVLMLLTSFRFFADRMERAHWKLLHTVGGYWIWLIFIITYTKRVLTEADYIPMALLLVTVFVLRMSVLIHQRYKLSASVQKA